MKHTNLFADYIGEVGTLDNIVNPQWPKSPISPKNIVPQEHQENGSITKELPTDQQSVMGIEHTQKRSAKELLQNLSEILNNNTQNELQRSEGQNLLVSLAELLNDEPQVKSSNLDDSGHSSINENSDPDKNTNDYYEVTDYSQKANSLNFHIRNYSLENSSIDEKSSKLSIGDTNRMSQSLNSALPTKSSQPKLLKRCSLSKVNSIEKNKCKSNGSISSGKSESLSSSNILGPQTSFKVRQKKEASKKGPLKAIIPLMDLNRAGKTIISQLLLLLLLF